MATTTNKLEEAIEILSSQDTTSLGVWGLSLSESSAEPLVESFFSALSSNTSLEALSLRVDLSDGGTLARLASALQSHATLEQLDLQGNGIYDVAPIAELLASNPTITHVSLANNGLGQGDLGPLLSVLSSHATLRSLSLASNELHHVNGWDAAIAANKSLMHLDLGANRITKVEPIAVGLASNCTLQSLSLARNYIYNTQALADVLVEHKSLTYVDISDCYFSTLAPFARVLELNDRLRGLELSGSRSMDVEVLIEPLEGNRTITQLSVDSALASPASVNKVSRLLERNNALLASGRLTFVLGFSSMDSPIQRLASHPLFDANLVALVFELLDGKSRTHFNKTWRW